MSCNFAIKKIRLTMSDRETIEIDGKHIGAFTVGEIERSAKTLGCNGFGILDLAGFVMLELHKDADLLYASFTNKNGTDKKRVFGNCNGSFRKNYFTRKS